MPNVTDGRDPSEERRSSDQRDRGELRDGDLWLGMPGSLKARDLKRDGRMALHSASVDPTRTTRVPGRAMPRSADGQITDPDT